MKFLLLLLQSKSLRLALVGMVYAVATAAAIRWVIVIHSPCKSNFEGGCGYASLFAGLSSFLAAWVALGTAAVMFAMASSFEDERTMCWIKVGAGALVAPPAFYILYCVWAIAAFLLTSPIMRA